MFTRSCRFYVIGFLALAALLMTGCDRQARHNPTAPDSSQSQSAESLSNFYSGQGVSDTYGAYVGHENFVIQVPAGEYLLEYLTDLGTFYLAFRATERALLYIGLHSGDAVQKAVVYPGVIIDTTGETQDHGNVTLFCWPGSSMSWPEVFRKS